MSTKESKTSLHNNVGSKYNVEQTEALVQKKLLNIDLQNLSNKIT